ncbi:MAG: DUF1015 family protein [Actinocatenispora sp.]
MGRSGLPVHPIGRAWISTGGTGAQNYDEFADDAEITAIVADNPSSALAIEMPHRTPEAVAAGLSFTDALPPAVRRFAESRASGRYRPDENVVALYRIGEGDAAAYGVFCMVDTDQISTTVDEPGLVIRNEDVFVSKIRERVALTGSVGHLLSPILLMQTGRGAQLQELLVEVAGRSGAPTVSDTDPQGRRHDVWVVPAGPDQDRILAEAGGGELIVADGNHRSLAAQVGELPRFLAVVTTPGSVRIQPYHRLVTEVPAPEGLVDRLRAAGAEVTALAEPPEVPAGSGTVHLYTTGGGYAVRLPVPDSSRGVDRLDYSVVEAVLFGTALEMEPDDKRIAYVGGDYPASWLRGEVDAGRADLAVLIAPVTVDDFVAVNLAREKLPRKSTWFTPKARAGLVCVELAAEPAG